MQLADQDEFLKKLDSLKETAFLCGGVITEEQISEVFPELDDAKKKYLEDYLKSQHIGIGEAIDPDSYMTGEDINLLEMYMESLDETVRLSDSKKRVMMMDALGGDKEAKNALISHYLPDVVDTAKLYTGQGVNIMDLIGEGNVALAIAMQSLEVCEAIEDVEPLVMKMVMNAMEECIGAEGNSESIDEKVVELTNKVLAKAKEMADELLRKVTVTELAKEADISEKRIRELLVISKELNDLIDNPDGE